MSVPLCLATRQHRLAATRDDIAAMLYYTSAVTPLVLPATPETATTETLLAIDTLAVPAGAIGASGNIATLTLTVPRVCSVLATGLVAWVRFVNSLGEGIMDLPVVAVGTAGSWPVIASQLNVYAGGDLNLLSCVITEA